MDDFEVFKTSVEKVTADVVEIARELELEVEPEDLTELLQSQDNTLTEKEVPLMDEQGKWFLEIESTFSEDIAKTVEMATKDLEYYRILVDKRAICFKRNDSNFERSSTLGKILSDSIAHYREIIHKSKSQLAQKTSLLSYFNILLQVL